MILNGKLIVDARNEMKMSQQELANISKVNRQTISNLETGTITSVTTDTLVKIAQALNKKPSDFFVS